MPRQLERLQAAGASPVAEERVGNGGMAATTVEEVWQRKAVTQSADGQPRGGVDPSAVARTLEQAPIAELESLRLDEVWSSVIEPKDAGDLQLGVSSVARQSEVIAVWDLPQTAMTFGIKLGPVADSDDTLACSVEYEPPVSTDADYYEVGVSCGDVSDTLRLLTYPDFLDRFIERLLTIRQRFDALNIR